MARRTPSAPGPAVEYVQADLYEWAPPFAASDAKQIFEANSRMTAASFSADGKTQHQSVITAMDAAGKLGFSHLRMTTVEAAPPAP